MNSVPRKLRITSMRTGFSAMVREDLSLAEKVPDAALAVEALVLLGLPLEMGYSRRLDIGAVEDFLARQVDGVLVE